MASAPPGRRLSVVALVASPRRFGARKGAAHRRPEVSGSEGAPRVVLSPGESPLDPSGVDPADPRPCLARPYRRLGGGSPRPRLGELRGKPIDPGRGGSPPARGLPRTLSPGGLQLARGPRGGGLTGQPRPQAPPGRARSLP